MMIGTPHYMSPEQINNSRDIDQRTDLYALGVISYEMFAGLPPFVGDTLQAIMTGHLFREPPRLASLSPSLGVPPPLADIVDRLLVKDAAGRYASAVDVLADLHDINSQRWPANAETLNRLHPTRVPGPNAPSPEPAPGKSRKRAITIIIGFGIVAVAIAIAVVALSPSSSGPGGPPVAAPAVPPTPALAAAVPSKPAPPVEPALDDAAVRKAAQTTLRASLKETEPVVRMAGSDALGKIKDQPSVPALTELTERDPDAEVRGHAADSLGVLGAASVARTLATLEAAAPPPLKVWYASALARLGDSGATRRLLGYSRSKDLAVSFKAGITLAELSQPGDKHAIAALRAIAKHEVELNSVAPYAGALILTRMAALRDAGARKALYGLLEHSDEGARLAAAEGLAKLGDDAGKQVLAGVFANQTSPNRMVAAVAQIAIGEYGGIDFILANLAAKEPAIRRLAARAVGELGDRKTLPALIALGNDKDWTVRVSAAAAIVAIVGLDPQVLAQTSIDWTKGALESQDWAVRTAAAGVLADIPEKQALPLLAQAIVDRDPKVRIAASRSAGKMKSADAVARIAIAVKAELDPAVKEQQVVALGAIGHPSARDTLAAIAEEPGRMGVLAAGSLIAIGDASGKQKLDAAITGGPVAMRLAAMQAASTSRNRIVVDTLKLGLGDRVFDVQFAAAEGLSMFQAEKAAAVPILTTGLASRDPSVVARALASLTRLGEKVRDAVKSPGELIDSVDRKLRLVARRHDIDHAGMALGSSDIERGHTAACDAGNRHHGKQHAGRMIVGGIGRLPLDLEDAVAPGQRLADVRAVAQIGGSAGEIELRHGWLRRSRQRERPAAPAGAPAYRRRRGSARARRCGGRARS